MATLVYDGECGFCRAWIERWRAWTGGAVEAIPAAQALSRFPDIPAADYERAVQYIGDDGSVSSGAEAIFRSLADCGAAAAPLRLYRAFPLFRRGSEAAYAFVAARRPLFSKLTRFFWGDLLMPPSYRLAARAFIVCLAGVYFCAFASLGVQVAGLIGPDGILPVAAFWAGTSDMALRAVCWAGAALSLALPFCPRAAPLLLLCLWGLYFSLFRAAGIFLGYQWDILLLEAGFLALFLGSGTETQPPRGALWAMRWLLFRLMLLSGAVKLLSGDPAWRGLTALTVHYETQPLATALAWYAHQLPAWVHKACTLIMFGIELLLPFFIFGPRRLRLCAAAGFILLMALICATGNYTYFNFLTASLCLFLFDDAWLRARFPGRFLAAALPVGLLQRRIALGLAVAVALIGGAQLTLRFLPAARGSGVLSAIADAGYRFHAVNTYGLFAVMTTARREIILEGSEDGRVWKAYEFKWKPGRVDRAPGWVQPHQPRLDWQMWFAALSPYQHNPWYFRFQQKILEGSPQVLALLEENPFPDKPPRFLRSRFYRYRFTAPGSEHWWTREYLGLYAPATTLR